MLIRECLAERWHELKTVPWKWNVKAIQQCKCEKIAVNQKKEELLLLHSIFHRLYFITFEEVYKTSTVSVSEIISRVCK